MCENCEKFNSSLKKSRNFNYFKKRLAINEMAALVSSHFFIQKKNYNG